MPQRSILLVEDNSDEVQLVCEALGQSTNTIEIHVAGTIDDAWKLLSRLTETELPALVVTDHHLPDDRGQALIARLQACPVRCRLPVVMVSGDAVRPPDLGTVPWFGKPDTWSGWCVLARELVKRLAND